MHSTDPSLFFFNSSCVICLRNIFKNQKSKQGHQSQACCCCFFLFPWEADLYTDQPLLLFSMCITFKPCLPAATLAPSTSPLHTLVSVWHRWHSYRQLMCERVRPMPVALSCCSPCGSFTLHFCQMCNIYSLLSHLWFCSEAYMTLVDMLLVILSSLVRRGWQTNSCHAGTDTVLKTQF